MHWIFKKEPNISVQQNPTKENVSDVSMIEINNLTALERDEKVETEDINTNVIANTYTVQSNVPTAFQTSETNSNTVTNVPKSPELISIQRLERLKNRYTFL
ncbi:MPN088 family protein [Mycoplasmoides pneumoniae]|uniref:MPN088 family protein n=1 Tax=Mycoplasmoides pneumoniae TaxID=2104 RepID=UPI00132FCF8E|nr:hypothetical protein [Mycoplasmoides pneumoniae]